MSNVNKREQRIGESKINFQGLKMTIVAYRNRHDLDIQFDDGYVKVYADYKEFSRGAIRNPNFAYNTDLANSRVGESMSNSQGLVMTLVAYHNSNDVEVRFADGEVVHCDYARFKSGSVQNPKYKRHTGGVRTAYRVGETNVNTQGDSMKIIEYISANDISVQFDDGSIRQHTAYATFKSGELRHPNKTFESMRRDLVGKKFVTQTGDEITVVQVRNCSDITVQFADGKIRDGLKLHDLQSGLIRHPDSTLTSHQNSRKGRIKLANCGLNMEILTYTNSDDITVKFETGHIRKARYREYCNGKIGHPFPYQIGNITMRSPAYIYNNEGNFYCFCNKCKKSDIMTIQEIKSHKCIEN